jgi:predicted AAA+ superfamily ATPase
MVLPQLADPLAGRMEIHTLWPFSQGEFGRARDTFIDALFAKRFAPGEIAGETWHKLTDRLIRGGYPEMLHRTEFNRRGAWFESYIMSILRRDVRDISNVRDLAEMPRLLSLVASRASSLLDFADLARGLSMPQTTLKRYMGLLEATFLVQTLPAWSANIGKRLVKAPKLLLNDTGLLTHLLGMDAERLKDDSMAGGAILENFVAMEMFKIVQTLVFQHPAKTPGRGSAGALCARHRALHGYDDRVLRKEPDGSSRAGLVERDVRRAKSRAPSSGPSDVPKPASRAQESSWSDSDNRR